MSEDLRVIKTKQNIESHFIELLEKYQFQDITIKLLISECQINRSTFYRNYEDKYDLLNKISKSLLDQFEALICTQFILFDLSDKKRIESCFMPLLSYFEKYKRIFLLMYKKTLPITIFDEMLSIYSQHLLKDLVAHYHILNSQISMATYFCEIIASNILTAIKWWHIESSETSKEKLLEMMTTSVTQGIIPSMQSQFK